MGVNKVKFFLFPLGFFFLSAFASHDLQLFYIQKSSSKAMVCFHGAGGNWKIINQAKQYAKEEETLVSFNFPDHSTNLSFENVEETHFGTLEELRPCFQALKKVVLEDGFTEVSLYGFSAGGGAIINMLCLLNGAEESSFIGLNKEEKIRIIQALRKGKILLDAPLKSIREVRDFRPDEPLLDFLANRYQENGLEPIDNLHKLQGLGLCYIVHFCGQDEVLSSRDSELFIERLIQADSEGTVFSIMDSNCRHGPPHPLLREFMDNLHK